MTLFVHNIFLQKKSETFFTLSWFSAATCRLQHTNRNADKIPTSVAILPTPVGSIQATKKQKEKIIPQPWAFMLSHTIYLYVPPYTKWADQVMLYGICCLLAITPEASKSPVICGLGDNLDSSAWVRHCKERPRCLIFTFSRVLQAWPKGHRVLLLSAGARTGE